MRKVYCDMCGNVARYEDFVIWNNKIYCSKECLQKDKKIKEEFENEKGTETKKES